jgi:hypothetical protein
MVNADPARGHLLAEREFGARAVRKRRLDHRVADGDVTARLLGQSDDVVVERVLSERDVRLDVGVLVVIDEYREVVAVTGDVLDVCVVQQRVDLSEPAEVAVEVVRQRVKGVHPGVDAVLFEQRFQFGPQRFFVGPPGPFFVQQRVANVVGDAVQQLAFELVEVGLDRVVPVFALLVVVGDDDVRVRRVHPVAVDLALVRRERKGGERTVSAGSERTDAEVGPSQHLPGAPEASTDGSHGSRVVGTCVPRHR